MSGPAAEPVAEPVAPSLTAEQRLALEQFMNVTDQTEAVSLPILRRSNWSVPVAIAKFFDGDDAVPDASNAPPPAAALVEEAPVAPPMERSINQPRPPQRYVDLGDPFRDFRRPPTMSVSDILNTARFAADTNRLREEERTEVARRLVVPPQRPVVRPPLLVAILLSPLNLGCNVLMRVWGAVAYVLGIVPGFNRVRAFFTRPTPPPLSPRDAAIRFKRDFEELYGEHELNFEEMGYTEAYDKAKAEPKFLVAFLFSFEHDETRDFVHETLFHPDVTELLNNPANHFMLWGGNVQHAEAFQISSDFHVTKLPFAAIISVTPKEGGSTRMGVVKRLAGVVTPSELCNTLRSVVTKYREDLEAVRAVRVANEVSRNIRKEQDDAYAQSLARDRERAEQRREAERIAREKAAAEERRQALRKQWRLWHATNLPPEPPAGTPGMVRVALLLSESRGGTHIRRSFASDATVEDLYIFVECHNIDLSEPEPEEAEEADEADEADEIEAADGATEENEAPAPELSEKIVEPVVEPVGYKYEFDFRIATVMPRVVHEPSDSVLLGDAIGRAARLIVEDFEEDSDL